MCEAPCAIFAFDRSLIDSDLAKGSRWSAGMAPLRPSGARSSRIPQCAGQDARGNCRRHRAASAAALGHHPAGEHRDEAIRHVCAIARRYQRVVKTEPRQRVAPAKSRAAQVSTRGQGALRSLFALATERGFRVRVPTNPTIVHVGNGSARNQFG
jgi:hypothetical protein